MQACKNSKVWKTENMGSGPVGPRKEKKSALWVYLTILFIYELVPTYLLIFAFLLIADPTFLYRTGGGGGGCQILGRM